MMTDWAAWGTSIGTLVLAGATFVAVRSSNRSARIAERSLLAGLRPFLAPSRPEDPSELVQFADGRVLEARAGRALVLDDGSVIYLAIPLRNFGTGFAVLRGYQTEAQTAEQVAADPRGPARHQRGDVAPDPSAFATQQRDLYVPPGRAYACIQATEDIDAWVRAGRLVGDGPGLRRGPGRAVVAGASRSS